MDLPTWLDKELWDIWCEQRAEDRRKKKKELTQRMLDMAIRRLTRFHEEGYSADEILESCIEKGWEGIYVGDCKPISEKEKKDKWGQQLGQQAHKLGIVR